MRILLVNQTFYPDVVATGQYLTDLALRLVERGHQVTVVASRRAYDHPEQRFPSQEVWRGIDILRAGSTGLGKSAKWRRAVDFGSFLALCVGRLALLPRQDAIVALTSPPLISFLGAGLARVRRATFFYWVMDFNPDEAVAAGWLRADSTPTRVLDWMSRFSLHRAQKNIALDRFMRQRILAKGVPVQRVAVIPPWSQEDQIRFDAEGRARFRRAHGLENKFVVMYSGNHSPVHPLDTLLGAAERLRSVSDITFCFVGGGSEWRKIRDACGRPPGGRADNLLCLPYQPLSELAGSLSAADLHVVVMGDAMLGLVHPCKIYNILSVGAPVLYVGPQPSHVTEIFEPVEPSLRAAAFASTRHGEVEPLAQLILRLREAARHSSPDRQAISNIVKPFSRDLLLDRLVAEVECVRPRADTSPRR